MARLFILIIKKSTGKPVGAVRARKGMTRSKLAALTRNRRQPGFRARIVNQAQLEAIIVRLSPKRRVSLVRRTHKKPSRRIRKRKVTKRKAKQRSKPKRKRR